MEEPKSDQLSKISNYISIAIGVVILGNHVKNGLSNLLSKIKEYYSHTVALISLVGNVQGGKKDCINLELHKEQITSAFKAHHVKAVVLVINTPGGSPVEASKLYTYLVSMKKKYPHKPLFAVTEECCASAGYYIACACDFIYSDASSIVGSIGVLSGGFGMEELVKKWGIEPRIHATGSNKANGSPFGPENSSGLANKRYLMDQLLVNFVTAVQNGRQAKDGSQRLLPEEAKKVTQEIHNAVDYEIVEPEPSKIGNWCTLAINNPGLFDGSYYDGRTALRIGLIDGVLGGGKVGLTMKDMLQQKIGINGKKIHLKEWKPKPKSFVEALAGLGLLMFGGTGSLNSGSSCGQTLAEDVLCTLETKQAWSSMGVSYPPRSF